MFYVPIFISSDVRNNWNCSSPAMLIVCLEVETPARQLGNQESVIPVINWKYYERFDGIHVCAVWGPLHYKLILRHIHTDSFFTFFFFSFAHPEIIHWEKKKRKKSQPSQIFLASLLDANDSFTFSSFAKDSLGDIWELAHSKDLDRSLCICKYT